MEQQLYELPEGWEWKELSRISAKIGSGATPKGGQKAYKSEGISLIRSLNVYDDGFRMKGLAFIDDQQASKLSNVVVEKNDVLLNITGASIARCCVVSRDVLPARVNQHVTIIRLTSELLPAFLHLTFVSPSIKSFLLNRGAGGATRQALTKAMIGHLHVPLPPLDEQKRIVAKLDSLFIRIDTAITHLQETIELSKALFASALSEKFRSREKSWKSVILADVCAITSKLSDPREPAYIDMIHVGGANIEGLTGELHELKTAREEKLISGKFPFDSRMVLYSKIRPYLMKVARPDFSGICSADIYPLTPKEGVLDREFLFYLLLSEDFSAFAIQGSSRAGMPKVNRKHLFGYKFSLPSLQEQRQISDHLDALSKRTRALEAATAEKLNDLTALKASLLDAAFRGHL